MKDRWNEIEDLFSRRTCAAAGVDAARSREICRGGRSDLRPEVGGRGPQRWRSGRQPGHSRGVGGGADGSRRGLSSRRTIDTGERPPDALHELCPPVVAGRGRWLRVRFGGGSRDDLRSPGATNSWGSKRTASVPSRQPAVRQPGRRSVATAERPSRSRRMRSCAGMQTFAWTLEPAAMARRRVTTGRSPSGSGLPNAAGCLRTRAC